MKSVISSINMCSFLFIFVISIFISSKYCSEHSLHSKKFLSTQLGINNNNLAEKVHLPLTQNFNTFLASYNLIQNNHKVEPYFDNDTLLNVTTSSKKRVFMPCIVRNLGDQTVTWIRMADLKILTVGKDTYASDQRFQVVHLNNSDDWVLQIGYPVQKDSGFYKCQISTNPPKSRKIFLNVVVSKAKIIGEPVIYLNKGNILNLTCVVKEAPDLPDYIFWYHNGAVINYDSPKGVKVHFKKSKPAMSKLLINRLQNSDSGNYSCVPSNADPAFIAVYVLNEGDHLASMQHGKRSAESFVNQANSNLSITKIFLFFAFYKFFFYI